MKKYKVYIPIALIIILFALLVYFRNDMLKEISDIRIEQLSPTIKTDMADNIKKLYDYSQNGEGYSYTFLEFGSTGCLPCRQMEEVMDEIKYKYKESVNVVFVNVMLDDNQDITNFFGISTIPTQVLLDKKGVEFFRHNGFLSAEELQQAMNL